MSNWKSLLDWLRLFPMFWNLSSAASADKSSEFFHGFESLSRRVVKREEFIVSICAGKRVLHFGFLDSPFLEQKLSNGSLLHARIKKHAEYAFGIDVDQRVLGQYRALTNDMDNTIHDIQTWDDSSTACLMGDYDVILFSEVLEHIESPLRALRNLNRVCLANERSVLCVTVPNAMSAVGFYAALRGYEMVHPDHFCYFSPNTLSRLLVSAGFRNIDMSLYTGSVRSPGITQHGVIALCTASSTV